MRNFSALEECTLHAICDENTERLRRHGAVGADVRLVGTLSAIIEDPEVEAVVLATPAETHARLARLALGAKKHVFVEKPMALSLDDALHVRAAADATGSRLMVGHILCYHPAVAALVELIGSGELGEIITVVAHRFSPAASTTGLNAWWNLAPHDASIIQSLLGADPLVIEATAHPDGAGLHTGVVTARLAFADDRSARIHVGVTASGQKTRRIVVLGTKHTAVFDDQQEIHKLHLFSTRSSDLSPALGGPSAEEWSPPGLGTAVPIDREEPLRAEARHFVEALRLGHPFRTDADHGVAITRVLQAGENSLKRHGAPVALSTLA